MSKKNGSNDIRIVKLEGQNVRTLSLVAVRLDGEPGLFRVTGENGAGKTTLLDIVDMLFGGKKAVKTETIQEGKDGAWCRAELNNGYSVEKRFTLAEPDGYLTVSTPDNAVVRAPQTLLDAWRGARGIDPGAMLRKKTSEIEDIILSLAKSPGLKAELAKIASRRAELKDERLPHNRTIQKAQRSTKPQGERPEPVDVSGEMARLKELQGVEDEREALARGVRGADHMVTVQQDALTSQEKLIADLRLRLAAEEAKLPRFGKELDKAMDAATEAEKAFLAVPDPAEDIEAVEARISEAGAVSDAIEPWREWDRAMADMEEAKQEADRLNQELDALAKQEEGLLRSADIPVPGITFGEDGGMLLDGHHLDVASGSRRMDMMVDIAIAANSNIKVILLDEANDYGLPALERLRERVTEQGWQVLPCRIGLEGPGEIVVSDGVAATAGEVGECLAEDLFEEAGTA